MVQKRKSTSLCLLCLLLLISVYSKAIVKMPHIFNDNMVIQRDQVVNVWGWADKNEAVEITFNNQTKKAKANKDGYWSVQLNPMAYGGPYKMSIKGKNNIIEFNNVLIGDVWICSGQSNMEWTVSNVNNTAEEISSANYPQIRSFSVNKDMSFKPLNDLNGTWEICSPQTVSNFTAVGYFFARQLNRELNIPIGIINTSWGGTDIETWTSSETFQALPEVFRERYSKNLTITDYDKLVENNSIARAAYLKAIEDEQGLKEKWYNPSTNVTSWTKTIVPQPWNQQRELSSADGVVWYRYDFTLTKQQAETASKIHLGIIDDQDITWINGIKIGQTDSYLTISEYEIPKNILKEGKNSLIVRVYDTGGDGGFMNKPNELYITTGNERYSLAGEWIQKISVTNKMYNYEEVSPNMYPSLLYNAMINPIVKYNMKGAIWYQGENNANAAYNYRTLFPAMIQDWRHKWGNEFPFYWVQLANFMQKDTEPTKSSWAELREAQSMTLSLPKTGQAVITDIGDANDIHPRNKQDVGLRLALIALNKDYGRTNTIYSGPTYNSIQFDGNKAIINFDNVDSGFDVRSKYGYIEGFAIAGTDQKYHWAKAYVDNGKVVVYSNKVSKPIAVRYCWSDNPDVNLYNKEGLPAAPFRTDDWNK